MLAKIKKDSAIKVIRPSAGERNVTLSEVMGRTSKAHTQIPASKQVPGSKQTVYAYDKNRTDTKQMPLNFFYSQRMPDHTEMDEQERQKFGYKFPDCPRDVKIKDFFG